jgi:hypothetical protein
MPEQLIFLVVIAVVGLLQWIARIVQERREAEAEKRGQSGAPPPPVVGAPPQRTPRNVTEEERVRKFMEALGVPTAPAPTAPPEPPRQTAPTPPPQRQQQPRPAKPPRTRPIDPFPLPRSAPKPPPLPTQQFPQPQVTVPAAPPTYQRPIVLPTAETTMFRPARTSTAAQRQVEEDAYALNVASAYEPSAPPTTSTAAPVATSGISAVAARLATQDGLREAIVLREIFGPPRSMQAGDGDRNL